MQTVHLLGSSTLVGKSFLKLNSSKFRIISYSRGKSSNILLDVNNLDTFKNINMDSLENSIIVSFAPIWVTSIFFQNLFKIFEGKFLNIKGIIACSSSSAKTKKFSINIQDKQLVKTLISAENNINYLCKKNNINSIILRPTIIYGSCDGFYDNNLFKLTKILSKLPFVFLPKNIGYRQPIHSLQLAKVCTYFIDKILNKRNSNRILLHFLEIGGDEILTYKEMIKRLKEYNCGSFNIFNARIITIPDFLFYLIISPFLIFKPKIFETLFRIGADFSGFSSLSQLEKKSPESFPFRKY
tara:strand:- start:7027 stop:7920 length:894 start_codon:yes stop_codon:yes gene_type:complete